ncbi:MAG TPA: DUF6798 domain-containing protein [Bryobacteraceae bacterium]|nr:DUF6798 domain-containing protein [Bryobacteraceae bacterium]
MKRLVTPAVLPPAVSLALALLSYFWFPGHTWLQQDSQIYVPILEHQRDPAVLRNDPVAEEPHTTYTLYDETAIGLSRATGLDFHPLLAGEQIAARALGIWGLYLLAAAAGLSAGPAWLVALAASLGAFIKGPEVLTFEYEPTPRALAVPLVMLAIGLAAHGLGMAAAIAGACALLFHPPAALPFWAVFAVMNGRRWIRLLPLVCAIAVLMLAGGGAHQAFFGRLAPPDQQLMRMRTAYVWISLWPARFVWHYAVVAAILAAAWMRVRGNGLLMGLAAIGLLSMPVSWLLLDEWNWRLMPQLQPMRWLLFTSLAMVVLAGIAGARAVSVLEAFAWFTVAFLLPLQPVLTQDFTFRHWAVALALAALATAAVRLGAAPVAGLAAFLAVPLLGGVVNYPRLHTPELARLSEWARAATPRDAVFLFPEAGHSLDPGIFRAQARRAVYVDWKSGGQMVYLPDFGTRWWFRWEQTMTGGMRTADLAKYEALGIRYAVVKRGDEYVVYDTHTGTPALQSR